MQGLANQQCATNTLAKDKQKARCFQLQASSMLSQLQAHNIVLAVNSLHACELLKPLRVFLHCRPEKITLQGLDLMGLDDNMASANLLEDALHALDTSDNPSVSFGMQVKLQSEAHKSLHSRHSCCQPI
jgi:hypothetical protein